ncbi:MAG: hypothetical protein A3A61_04250 [Candidatus Woykebacteria bacterium RIFCSPLOWO2_01_FULL_43_14]|uniref:Nudix hydrolase domain-containing protein n=2 Tax=Candidatus Woykeibacteriota TaxID=1817899 RepID=A0A1G1WY62_9BACT|nr:MAG: hypothetical protein A3J50_03245 [Candidatus Woykebacteria bacterium RIFCSPHIGHO2_02_FULL_43_16b]OGY32270.1 MAG: hypothetical protein A3A61_04250 [Candidatus Woykebacteria bacterium RIFCSPLOWO2_01_FULL_43_14]
MSIIKKDRFKLVPAVFLLFFKEDKLLLLHRANTGHNDGKYGLVSGHVDGEESVRRAGVREAYEEVGVSINENDLRFVHVMHRRKGSNDHERVDFYFVVEKWQSEPGNTEPDKCDDLSWFPIEQLPKNLIDYVQVAIESFRQGHLYSEFGWDKNP